MPNARRNRVPAITLLFVCLFTLLFFLQQAFRDLDLSDATFEELRRQPEDNITLREFVCVQVGRLLCRAMLR